ncbi:MAG: hypothetical protein QXS85_03975 [Acidilobaceae archaeon]
MSSKREKQAPRRVEPRDLVEAMLTPELLERASRELLKEPVVTPFRAAQKLGVKVSTARRLLARLAESGLLKPAGGTRRARLYVPAREVKA